MATRSADIASGASVDISTALSLASGRGYVIELGPNSQAGDVIFIALGGDPELLGGHVVTADRPRLIRQSGDTWYARFYGDPKFPRETQLTATEASVD